MRTKTIETIIDRGFWALILLLPMLIYLVVNHHGSADFITILGQFYVNDTNIIYTGLSSLFGNNGILEFLDTTTTNPIILYMSYFVILELVHIFIDILLFVPKACVAILDKSSQLGKI